MPIVQIVNYIDFDIKYNLIESHLDHAPMRVTSRGHIWEKKIYNIYSKLLNKDDIVIDIGAYIGTHTIPMSKFSKKVYAFEANPDIFCCLKKNVECNSIENININNCLISDSKKQLDFYKRLDGTSRVSNKSVKGECLSLESDSLDNIIGTDEKIKLIKIDVEGHEFNVLEGCKKIIELHRPIIIIEVFKNKKKQLEEYVTNNNYNMTWLKGDDYLLEPNIVV
ncbi:MAG: FkbM family methyltransferase [Planctomycetota bacterium]|jgi:FkbM family methyltransferase